jgi:hypothetical protein
MWGHIFAASTPPKEGRQKFREVKKSRIVAHLILQQVIHIMLITLLRDAKARKKNDMSVLIVRKEDAEVEDLQ